jgi:hypothetical protein
LFRSETEVNRPAIPAFPGDEAEEIRQAQVAGIQHTLSQVLDSPSFRNSRQCRKLLEYIVEHTLSGQDHLLRERVIGAEVFGRPADYETSQDPVVRLRAADVRKRLAQFYQSSSEPIEVYIDVPAGGYRATFQRPEEHPVVIEKEVAWRSTQVQEPLTEKSLEPAETIHPAPSLPFLPEPARSARRGLLALYGVAALLIFAVLAVAGLRWTDSGDAAYQAFWAPWIASRRPVLIAIGTNAVYRLSDSINDSYAKQHNLEPDGEEFYVQLSPDDTLHARDLIPQYNSFIALPDVASVSRIVAAVTRFGKGFQERFPDDYSFAELRSAPSILVGGFNNPMTLELTRHLEFVLRKRNEIDDAYHPNRRWILRAPIDARYTEDYAILTRLVPKNGDAPMIAVAGLGQYGTLAASDFICSSASILGMSRQLPKDWAKKNLQVILHVNVVDYKPVSTKIVAVHSW